MQKHLLFALFALFSSAAWASPVGTWIGEFNGQTVELRLNAGGTGSLAGEPGNWQLSGNTLYLVSNDGTPLTAQYRKNSIVVSYGGAQIPFRRHRGVSTPAPNKDVGLRAVPSKKLRIKGVKGSVNIPKGWRHKILDDELVLRPQNKKHGAVSITYAILTDQELRQPLNTTLSQAVAEQLGENTQVNIVMPATNFQISGRRAARGIIQGYIKGAKLEGYVGAVLFDRWAYIAIGLYPEKYAKKMRPAYETILGSIYVVPPQQNKKLERKLVGCWQYVGANYTGGSAASSRTKYYFRSDNTFQYESFFAATSAPGIAGEYSTVSTKDNESGVWAIYEDTLYVVPDGKDKKEFSLGKGKHFFRGYRSCN